MNGYETARKIRAEGWATDIVIVALSGWGQEQDKRNSHEAGIDHHLVKPVEPSVLLQLLAMHDSASAGATTG